MQNKSTYKPEDFGEQAATLLEEWQRQAEAQAVELTALSRLREELARFAQSPPAELEKLCGSWNPAHHPHFQQVGKKPGNAMVYHKCHLEAQRLPQHRLSSDPKD